MEHRIPKRLTSLALVLLSLSLIVGVALRGGEVASAHSAVAHHATVQDVAAKKKYHGIKIYPNPLQQNDIDTPTVFFVIGSGLTPRGIYDISLDSFNLDMCDAAVLPGAVTDGTPGPGVTDSGEDGQIANTVLPAILTGDGTGDIKADTEGRLTFTVAILNCVAGTYSLTITNDARSGDHHTAHVKVKAP